MLSGVDRVQLAVADRAGAARGWVEILGAEHAGDDRVACLGALRSRYRLGDGWLELLEPDGAGPVDDALRVRGRSHLYAGGVSTPDVTALAAHLQARGVEPPSEGSQLFLDTAHTGGHGLRLVVSPAAASGSAAASAPVGRIDHLYEITNLVRDAGGTARHYAELFGLDTSSFCPIRSEEYGYDGILTLFDPDRLDRLEVITPRAPEKTMGRFFAKQGETLYMCFAETGELSAIEERVQELGVPHTRVPPPGERPGSPDTIFLHPPALGGMMLGLSRRTVAWVWSGHPERVERLP